MHEWIMLGICRLKLNLVFWLVESLDFFSTALPKMQLASLFHFNVPQYVMMGLLVIQGHVMDKNVHALVSLISLNLEIMWFDLYFLYWNLKHFGPFPFPIFPLNLNYITEPESYL